LMIEWAHRCIGMLWGVASREWVALAGAVQRLVFRVVTLSGCL
jgi:hypothetical protein